MVDLAFIRWWRHGNNLGRCAAGHTDASGLRTATERWPKRSTVMACRGLAFVRWWRHGNNLGRSAAGHTAQVNGSLSAFPPHQRKSQTTPSRERVRVLYLECRKKLSFNLLFHQPFSVSYSCRSHVIAVHPSSFPRALFPFDRRLPFVCDILRLNMEKIVHKFRS